MIKIREIIVVEGRYDKNKLSQIVDAVIIETNGFGIFSDKEKLNLIRKVAAKHGLIILTDSDASGFLIRNYLKGSLNGLNIKQAYIPDIFGKEKRKNIPSAEGKLGVEGMPTEVILNALIKAGATVEDVPFDSLLEKDFITKADLYEIGLSGKESSGQKRKKLLSYLDLPERIAPNSLLDVLNVLFSREEFYNLVREVFFDDSGSDNRD